MIKYCGNEGTSNDKRTASLRKLLQAVIDCLQGSHKHTDWRNAEVTVYDHDDNSFMIISGQGKHQFVVSDVDNGEPEIVNISNKVTKTKEVRIPQRSGHQQDGHTGEVNINAAVYLLVRHMRDLNLLILINLPLMTSILVIIIVAKLKKKNIVLSVEQTN